MHDKDTAEGQILKAKATVYKLQLKFNLVTPVTRMLSKYKTRLGSNISANSQNTCSYNMIS